MKCENFFLSGCADSPAKAFPTLFHGDPRCGSDPQVHDAPLQAQRLVVLPALDGVHVLDLTPRPRWHSSRLVDMPIWKNFSLAVLALCGSHIVFTSCLFPGYVFHRDQTSDVFKARHPH